MLSVSIMIVILLNVSFIMLSVSILSGIMLGNSLLNVSFMIVILLSVSYYA